MIGLHRNAQIGLFLPEIMVISKQTLTNVWLSFQQRSHS